jgi:hypothetical protein
MSDPQEAATPSDPHSAEARAKYPDDYNGWSPQGIVIPSLREGFDAGRVSRDAEVAELRAEKERWHDAALIGLAQESAARSEVAELKAKIAAAVARLNAASIPPMMTEAQFNATTITDARRILLGSASSPVEGGN